MTRRLKWWAAVLMADESTARIEQLIAEIEATGQEVAVLRRRNRQLQIELAAVTSDSDLAHFDRRNRELGEDVDACVARAAAIMDEVGELGARKARLEQITLIVGAIILALVLLRCHASGGCRGYLPWPVTAFACDATKKGLAPEWMRALRARRVIGLRRWL